MITRFFFLLMVIFAVPLVVSAQIEPKPFPNLLGDAIPGGQKFTAGGIAVETNNFDWGGGYKQKANGNLKPRAREQYRIEFTPDILISKGAGHLVEEFQRHAQDLIGDTKRGSDFIVSMIDIQHQEMRHRLASCGDVQVPDTKRRITFSQLSRELTPNRFDVTVEESPFWIQELGIWAVGVARYENGKVHIHVTAIAADSLSRGREAYLRIFPDIMLWELGNTGMLIAEVTRGEWGNNPTCNWQGGVTRFASKKESDVIRTDTMVAIKYVP